MSTPDQQPWIGVQVGAHTLYDEGIEHAFDLLRNTCQAKAVVVCSHGGGWRGAGSWVAQQRADHGRPLPEPPHYAPATWVPTHDEHYRGLAHRWPQERETHYGACDIIEDCSAAAVERGIDLYARFFECRAEYNARGEWDEVDADGRATGRRCVNNPDWRAFSQATAEDLVSHHPQLTGVMYLQERHGPLDTVFGHKHDRAGHCFCEHCCRLGRERGLDPERARAGYRQISRLAAAAHADEPRPSDGWFLAFLRLLTSYPEILAWEQLFWDGIHGQRQAIYRAAKGANREVRVGWHIHHTIAFSPFTRAGLDYRRMQAYSDWVKPVVYHHCSGKRSRNHWFNGPCGSLFKDLRPEIALGLMQDVLGYDPAHLPSLADYQSGDIPGFDDDYVYRETARAVAGCGTVPVYAGVGFDLPGDGDRPEMVEVSCRAALRAGAKGLLISREYEEMQVAHLEAVGSALRPKSAV
jgi:hypothetical protein